jgi:putative drug exporter of the RND superfamily
MSHPSNLAASLGGWSALYRLSAIGGWLLLVVVTMLIGGAVGQVTMTQAEYGTGESGRAEQFLTRAGVAEPTRELVLVHSATATAAASGLPGRRARGPFRRAGHREGSGCPPSGSLQRLE